MWYDFEDHDSGGDHVPVSRSPFVSCFRAGGCYRCAGLVA